MRTFRALKLGAAGTSAEAGRPAKQISAMLTGLLNGEDADLVRRWLESCAIGTVLHRIVLYASTDAKRMNLTPAARSERIIAAWLPCSKLRVNADDWGIMIESCWFAIAAAFSLAWIVSPVEERMLSLLLIPQLGAIFIFLAEM